MACPRLSTLAGLGRLHNQGSSPLHPIPGHYPLVLPHRPTRILVLPSSTLSTHARSPLNHSNLPFPFPFLSSPTYAVPSYQPSPSPLPLPICPTYAAPSRPLPSLLPLPILLSTYPPRHSPKVTPASFSPSRDFIPSSVPTNALHAFRPPYAFHPIPTLSVTPYPFLPPPKLCSASPPFLPWPSRHSGAECTPKAATQRLLI